MSWHKRCEVLHENNEQNTTNLIQHLHPQVTAIYEQKTRLDSLDQTALEQPITSTLAIPLKAIRDWIKRVGTFVRQGIARAQRRTKSQNHAITNFFAPVRNRINHRSHAQDRNQTNSTDPADLSPDPNANENSNPP
jgi:hypothetical protein